ncbi:MAG: 30S ribosomal protein S16 [Acidimicrobiales bacterium]
MAVKLRLVRMGKKKQPTYRVVAADSRSPRDGRFLEVLGTYAPRGRSRADDETIITIDHEKALRWLRQGAKPTERVERLLRTSGTLDLLAGGAESTAAEGASGTSGASGAAAGEGDAAAGEGDAVAGEGDAAAGEGDAAAGEGTGAAEAGSVPA